ncbi:hypothetical protein CBM2586_B10666 [Cupriavidus phytorum]|uniref:Uncharacterized protein n=1 Tax=Cupriavidus taiwanensis TaxID=164546 RepID=A0A975XCU6_9BURK|nr:hypothetical protein CBM2586_B10666 [Cupriavidus taiwanensis]
MRATSHCATAPDGANSDFSVHLTEQSPAKPDNFVATGTHAALQHSVRGGQAGRLTLRCCQ